MGGGPPGGKAGRRETHHMGAGRGADGDQTVQLQEAGGQVTAGERTSVDFGE